MTSIVSCWCHRCKCLSRSSGRPGRDHDQSSLLFGISLFQMNIIILLWNGNTNNRILTIIKLISICKWIVRPKQRIEFLGSLFLFNCCVLYDIKNFASQISLPLPVERCSSIDMSAKKWNTKLNNKRRRRQKFFHDGGEMRVGRRASEWIVTTTTYGLYADVLRTTQVKVCYYIVTVVVLCLVIHANEMITANLYL